MHLLVIVRPYNYYEDSHWLSAFHVALLVDLTIG
jgi:hypothetical protein